MIQVHILLSTVIEKVEKVAQITLAMIENTIKMFFMLKRSLNA